jgi:hypothetical protein
MRAERYWKVRVDVWVTFNREREAPQRVIKWYLLCAKDSDEARAIAVAQGEKDSPFGPLFLRADFREGATVQLPFDLSAFAKSQKSLPKKGRKP